MRRTAIMYCIDLLTFRVADTRALHSTIWSGIISTARTLAKDMVMALENA